VLQDALAGRSGWFYFFLDLGFALALGILTESSEVTILMDSELLLIENYTFLSPFPASFRMGEL
jgi:hypothetical protein